MKKLIILVFFLTLHAGLMAMAEKKYPVSAIPAELMKDAQAVVRLDEIQFFVNSAEEATMKVKLAVTILNENGISESYLIVPYNRFYKVRNIEGIVYNASGEKEKRIPNGEIVDVSAGSGFSIYEDTRMKGINPNYRNYPFTVEYSYEMNMNGILNYPDWNLFGGYHVAVEQTSMEFSIPKTMSFRHKAVNCQLEPVVTEKDGRLTYKWESRNLKALKPEPFDLPFGEYAPRVILTPEKFKLDGYEGTSKTWNEIGFWNLKLQQGRMELPEETVARIRELTASAPNDMEKIRILYEYMQNKVRYVSIQIGIGGFQPFPAETVDRLSYGDCKALSLYMKAMLKVAGIPSNYTLVMAGKDAERTDLAFPDISFNHAILFVPLPTDTIWLECTSQSLPCGYLGSFTDDRSVLAITDFGGQIVHTPVYTEKENLQSRRVEVKIEASGHALASSGTRCSGYFYDQNQQYLHMDDESRKKAIYKHIEIPTFELYSSRHEEIKTRIPEILEKLELGIPNFTSLAGDRMILEPNLMNKMKRLPVSSAERKSDVFIRRSTKEVDSILYKLPEGYSCDKLPAPVSISSSFGSYTAQISLSNGVLCYIRTLQYMKGTFPASDYPRLVEYIDKIVRADGQKIVLMKHP